MCFNKDKVFMKISSLHIYNNSTPYFFNLKSDVRPRTEVANNTELPTSFMGREKVLTDGLKSLKQEVAQFPKDIEYRKTLLKEIGIEPSKFYKLRSIIGTEEIKKILSELSTSPEYYTAGENYENTINGMFRANLHIHTTASDGFFSTQELLDKGAEYADHVKNLNPTAKNPFVIAITDHDCLVATKEAIQIIESNPLKYKNLRVILGAEMTTFDNVATDIVDYPTNAHILVYGLNPFDKKFQSFIESYKEQKFAISDKMTSKANYLFEKSFGRSLNFSTEEVKAFSNQFRKGQTGAFNHIDKYINVKFLLGEIILKNANITSALKKNNFPTKVDELLQEMIKYYFVLNRNNYTPSAESLVTGFVSEKTKLSVKDIEDLISSKLETPEIKDFKKSLKDAFEGFKITLHPKRRYVPNYKALYSALSNQENTLIGIAHPLDYVSKITSEKDKYLFLTKLFDKFKKEFKEKGLFSETYYQSYMQDTKNFNENEVTVPFLQALNKTHDMYNSGGVDCHRNNLFKRY